MTVYEVYVDSMYHNGYYDGAMSADEILEEALDCVSNHELLTITESLDEAIEIAKDNIETERTRNGFFVQYAYIDEIEYDDNDETDDGTFIGTVDYYVEPLKEMNYD